MRRLSGILSKVMPCVFVWCILICIAMTACQEDILTHNPAQQLTFSHDSLLFDTVFTNMGSSTKRMMVYNPNKNALCIDRVEMKNCKSFFINLDGENQLDNMRDITLRGGDSLFLFVRVEIDPQDVNTPVLVEDTIVFHVNQKQHNIYLQAYGQDVRVIQSKEKFVQYDHWVVENDKPYLIYDTVVVAGNMRIKPGATLYMHSGAMIYAYGSVTANGSQEQPIVIRGDRTDMLFDSVPYRVASGQWNGLYLVHLADMKTPTYTFDYVDILSGSIGLYAISESTTNCPRLSLSNGRIHNHSIYGLVLQNIDATVVNTEISNCASYCVYLAGGKHNFAHNTIASYFGYPYTTINIHNNILREDVAAVYINNLSKNAAPTISSFYNCIITGARKNNVVVATPLPDYYEGKFVGNYLRADSLSETFAQQNVYATDSDTVVFRNIHYLYKEYRYYDFQLDSLSPARGIADSVMASHFPYDRLGNQRKSHPDAGCYEYKE